jgi:hypothetical protein
LPEDNLIILGIVGIKVLMKFWVFASSILNYSK